MTKVQVDYNLIRPLTDADAEAVANSRGVYGIMSLNVAPSLDRLSVDYDASRLSELEVQAALIRKGVPLRREPVAASGV